MRTLLERIAEIDEKFAHALQETESKGQQLIAELRESGALPPIEVNTAPEAQMQVRQLIRTGKLTAAHLNAIFSLTKQIITASPWAWFTSELKNLFGLKPFPSIECVLLDSVVLNKEASGISTTNAFALLREGFGFKKSTTLSLFKKSKKTNNRIFLNERLIFHQPTNSLEQAIRRFLLEYNDLEKKPLWFLVLLEICDPQLEGGFPEFQRKFGTSPATFRDSHKGPRMLTNNIVVLRGRTTKETSWGIKREFFEQVYKPIQPWLMPPGCDVFSDWKQKFHFGRRVE